MQLQPYLFFDGRAEEAIAFYKEALGAEVNFCMYYRDNPEPSDCQNMPPGAEDKVQHAELRIGGATVMLSDGMCQGAPQFNGFSLSLVDLSEEDAERFFSALAEGGEIHMPMTETFFATRFGMVTDRFGMCWMTVGGAKEEE